MAVSMLSCALAPETEEAWRDERLIMVLFLMVCHWASPVNRGSTHNEAHWGVMGGTGTGPLVIPAVGNSGLPEGVGRALVPHAPGAANRELP